jgi:hypothetical protein
MSILDRRGTGLIEGFSARGAMENDVGSHALGKKPEGNGA